MKSFSRWFAIFSVALTAYFFATIVFGDGMLPAKPARPMPADAVLVMFVYMAAASISAVWAGWIAREPRP